MLHGLQKNFCRSCSSSRRRRRQIFLLILMIYAILIHLSKAQQQQHTVASKNDHNKINGNLSPEGLFRYTHKEWLDSINKSQEKALSSSPTEIAWHVWVDFSSTLVQEYQRASSKSPSSASRMQKRHLEIIGAIEESILTIERYLAHEEQQQQQPQKSSSAVDDSRRDAVLAELYVSYGILLEQLTPIECWKLASDPHTLLIGAPERLEEFSRKLQQDGQEEVTLIQTMFSSLCLDNADNAVRNAMTLDATNTRAIELLETLTGESDPTLVHRRKPKEFVAELFDSFAGTFDDKLTGTLHYQVPQLIGEAVQKSTRNHGTFQAVLDAGCGTGLAGRHLRPLIQDEPQQPLSSGIMVGVDASSKMLDIAAKCTRAVGCGTQPSLDSTKHEKVDPSTDGDTRLLYDRLLQMDLEEMTTANTLDGFSQVGFDLVVAADVLVYFGSLENILQVFASLCSKNTSSWLVFSCERALPEEAPMLGFRLMSTGRFAHTKGHVLEMANKAGYVLKDYNEIIPRMEKGEPVKGHLFVFEMRPDRSDSMATEL